MANVAVVSARFQSGQRHGGFANEKEKFEKGLDNGYSNQTSLREGILSSFETELYSLIEVTVLNLCKKSFEIYAGDYRLRVDPRRRKKAISPLTGTTGSRVPRSSATRRGLKTLKTRIKR